VFLICYKPDYINYHGENSHKILEYLSTGKTVVSSHISLYSDSQLLSMAKKDRNEELISIIDDVISNIEKYNAPDLMKQRILFALENTYANHIHKIESHLAL